MFHFWVREFEFWLLAYFVIVLNCTKFEQPLTNLILVTLKGFPMIFFASIFQQKFKGGTFIKWLISSLSEVFQFLHSLAQSKNMQEKKTKNQGNYQFSRRFGRYSFVILPWDTLYTPGSKDFTKWHQNFPSLCNLASSKHLSNLYQCNYIVQYSCSEPSKVYCSMSLTLLASRLPTSYYCIAIQLLCQIHLLWSHTRARTEYEWLTKSVFTIVKFHLVVPEYIQDSIHFMVSRSTSQNWHWPSTAPTNHPKRTGTLRSGPANGVRWVGILHLYDAI